ncbi:chromosomal replication initiator protein DnaA [Mycoplasmopsis lipofaciens]|uniref:chromosomal replication initiator protein DnaA n=1 Tax=Mycoplasmopsis lipofaciens TaxID=114884 RepID=UPI0004870679|nr:chromosomal replication initiator protein DnaA [Mycoplasmopsis lipofaciens]
MKVNKKTSEKNALLKSWTATFLNSINSDIPDRMLYKNFFSTLEIYDVDQNNHVTISTTLADSSILVLKNLFGTHISKALEDTFEKHCDYSFITIKEETQIKKNKKNSEKIEIENNLIKKESTFSNYVKGNFNEEVIKIAQYIIAGGKEYNPIFIYAKSGLGKTHLLHAIANELLNKKETVKLINPITFARDISFLLQENDQKKLKTMKDEFDNVDILMFDDFQNYGLGNKKSTILTIYNILDNRIQNNKITIFCSDKPIFALSAMFDERLVSRLNMGLQLEIKQPEQNDLLKVLNFLLDINHLNPNNWEEDAKKFVTRNYSTSIRTLIGAITRIKFFSSEIKKRANSQYTLTVVHQILDTLQKNKENITPDSIIEYVSKYYKIPKKEVLGKTRKKEVVLARHIAIYIIRKQLDLSLDEIGRCFGNRDHSTILNAINKIEKDSDNPDNTLKRTISIISDDIYKLK